MLEFLIFAGIALTICLVTIIFLRLKNTNMKLMLLLGQTLEDIEVLREGFNGDSLVEKEHLISFLTQTREDAFKYIEDMHKSLIEYKNEIEFDLENPSDLSIIRFRSAFDKLQKILPEDIPND
jgi:hypothetical protein